MNTSFIHTISTLFLFYIHSLQCFRVLCVYSGMSADVLHSLLHSLLITTSLTDHCSYELLVRVFCCYFLPIQKIYK
ncbi:hypothetical protein BDB01DRAFT_815067 [Pilobolus umbonatus]|nr:hypothetical protein BDB01DRAFT_815067 [Pilobolus umbonatus]